jgi:ABC-type transport system involved in cytochrome c biogenesis permease subunit
MAIKWTIQGALIYLAMAGYVVAFVAELEGRAKTARGFFLCGLSVAAGGFVYRWLQVKHVPLQNLFEVFLCMGMAAPLLCMLCSRLLHTKIRATDMVMAAVVLIPAGFVFSAQPQKLPPALQCWLFAPHIAVYVLSYIIMAKAAVEATFLLSRRPGTQQSFCRLEQETYELVSLGLPLMTLGLVLGSCWGKLAWGDYWGWDPKEMWSLASWLAYVGYVHFRRMYVQRYMRLNALWVLSGFVLIVLTLFWANLSSLFAGLHSYAV